MSIYTNRPSGPDAHCMPPRARTAEEGPNPANPSQERRRPLEPDGTTLHSNLPGPGPAASENSSSTCSKPVPSAADDYLLDRAWSRIMPPACRRAARPCAERLHRGPADGVEAQAVAADAPRPVGLLHKHDGGSVARRRVLDPPAAEHHRARPRHRRVARLDDSDKLHAAVRRQPWRRATEHVRVLCLDRVPGAEAGSSAPVRRSGLGSRRAAPLRPPCQTM
jgi:hypothetical protein